MNDNNPVTSSERAGMIAAIIVVAVAVLVMWVWQVSRPAPDNVAGEKAMTVTEVSVAEAPADTASVTPVRPKRKRARKASAPPRRQAPQRNPLDEPVEGF